MIKGSKRSKDSLSPLSKKAILSKIDDYSIMSHYLGEELDLKKKYSSPLRDGKRDENPNLSFFVGDDDEILFKDFAGDKSGDCIKFVQAIYNLDYNEALKKIDEDFGLGILSNSNPVFKINITKKPDSIFKQEKLIQVFTRDFTEGDLKYWSHYEINKQELENKDVSSVDTLYINKKRYPFNNLRFAYLFDNRYVKVYTPLSKEYKWISSCPNDFMSGFDNIKFKIFKGNQDKKLIISKSVKDEIILSKFFKDVCSTQNESLGALNEENVDTILRGYDPKNVYVAYDSDKAGVSASTAICKKYGFNYVNVPKIFLREGIKDWADLVRHKGLDTLENYLKIKKLV